MKPTVILAHGAFADSARSRSNRPTRACPVLHDRRKDHRLRRPAAVKWSAAPDLAVAPNLET
jgi:hypothetical protein